MASHVEEVARAHGIVGVEENLAEAGEVRAARDFGQDGGVALDERLTADACGEAEAEQALADEGGADAQETAMVKEGEARTRPRPARRGVDLARPPHERVAGDG